MVSFLQRWRLLLLPALILGGILLFPGFKKALQIDNSLTAWFIEGDPALESYYEYQEYFGNDEVVIMLYQPSEGLFTPEALSRLRDFSDSLSQRSFIAQISGPGNAQVPKQGLLGVQARPLIPAKAVQPDKVRATLEEHPFLKEQFFSGDAQAARFVFRLTNSEDFDTRRGEILKQLYAVAEYYFPRSAIHFGGIGVIYEALNELSRQDFGRFLAVGYLLMFVLIYLIYRRWRDVLYALLTIAFSTYFTLAIYGTVGLRLNLMTTLIPAIIILLCVMDVMHILNERAKGRTGESQPLAILKRVWWPCLFTSLTTMAGFLTLVVSPIKILVSFGLFSALGILLGLFFSFLLGTFFIDNKGVIRPFQQRISTQLQNFQKAVLGSPVRFIAFSVLLGLTAALGLSRVEVDTESIGYLPKDHWVRQDSRAIEAALGPYMPLEYLVYPQDSLTMQSPEILSALSRFGDSVAAWPRFGRTTGYHLLFEAALKERYGADWQKHWQSRAFLQQVAQQAEVAFPKLSRDLVTADGQVGRLSLSGELVSAGTLKQKMADIALLEAETLQPYARIEATGYQSLYARIVNYVTQSQVNSFLLAIAIIYLLLWLFLKDPRLAFLSLLPNFFPVLIMLGFMGWAGINLDTATACIASIVLSFSIDDTMHFAYHYKRLKGQGMSLAEARRSTIGHVGRAILLTSLVLFTGYILMVFGALKTVVYFGLLTAVAIIAALFAQLVIFPLVLARFDR